MINFKIFPSRGYAREGFAVPASHRERASGMRFAMLGRHKARPFRCRNATGTAFLSRPVSGARQAQVVLPQPLQAGNCGGRYGLDIRHRNRFSFESANIRNFRPPFQGVFAFLTIFRRIGTASAPSPPPS